MNQQTLHNFSTLLIGCLFEGIFVSIPILEEFKTNTK